MIFVFGSNEAGHHGAGAARTALMAHGARTGQGFGPNGSSFAIPTKDWRIQTLPYAVIDAYVQRFIVYARMKPQSIFKVTRIGCGLAGLRDEHIAPFFKYAPKNCLFDQAWESLLPKDAAFWGTF